jgi:NAD-dependent dihydropyrimidine dehydrogenase PreA subunit
VRDVLTLIDRGEDDEVDEDDWDDEDAKAMMIVKNPGDCTGCGACGRTCPKGCFTFVSA